MNLEKKEPREFDGTFKSYVGLEEFSILAVNPTRQELNKLFEKENSDEDEDIEYIDEREGEDRVRISIWLRGRQTNRIKCKNFFIVNKVRESKLTDEEREQGKTPSKQYVNQVGRGAFADSKENLPDWITNFQDKDKNNLEKMSVREALEGEVDLYTFLRGALQGVKYNSPTTDIRLDFKKMLKGKFTDLSPLMDSDYSYPFVAMNYIKTDIDGKEYNEIWTKRILNASILGKVANVQEMYYKEYLAELREDERFKDYPALTINDIYGYVSEPGIKLKNEFDNRAWKGYCDEIQGQWGCKGFFKLCPVFEYKSDMNPISGASAVVGNGMTDY